jgi:hypothetical protein
MMVQDVSNFVTFSHCLIDGRLRQNLELFELFGSPRELFLMMIGSATLQQRDTLNYATLVLLYLHIEAFTTNELVDPNSKFTTENLKMLMLNSVTIFIHNILTCNNNQNHF